jgi:hypothetical protein
MEDFTPPARLGGDGASKRPHFDEEGPMSEDEARRANEEGDVNEARRANEEGDVDAHRRQAANEEAGDEAEKTDDDNDVEAHARR